MLMASWPEAHYSPEDVPEPRGKAFTHQIWSPAPDSEAKPLQKGKAIIKRNIFTTKAAKTSHIDKKGKVERLSELGRAGTVTRALRKARKWE